MPRILLFFLRHGPVTAAVFLTPNAKPRNLTELCIMIDSVHDSVRAKNDLANIFSYIRARCDPTLEFMSSRTAGDQISL